MSLASTSPQINLPLQAVSDYRRRVESRCRAAVEAGNGILARCIAVDELPFITEMVQAVHQLSAELADLMQMLGWANEQARIEALPDVAVMR